MTWTFTNAPATNQTDEVRLLIGDTLTTSQLITDEEIAYFLIVYPKPVPPLVPVTRPAYLAAAAAADAIAASFARKADRSLARGLSIQASQQYDHYVAVAASLREAYITGGIGKRGARPALPKLGGGGTGVLGNEPDYRRIP